VIAVWDVRAIDRADRRITAPTDLGRPKVTAYNGANDSDVASHCPAMSARPARTKRQWGYSSQTLRGQSAAPAVP
jgi:hypothetical protein